MKNRFLYGVFVVLCGVGSLNAQEFRGSSSFFFTTKSGDPIKVDKMFNAKDTIKNNDLKQRLKPIQANFKRINANTKWTSVKKRNIEGESAEGGEVIFYYTDHHLEKLVARHYGETGQMLTEYYLLNGQLSFVLEKKYRYNRPLFYDDKTMKDNNDTEAFDFKKSEITATRSYFENGSIIMITNHGGRESDISTGYPSEQEKNLTEDFEKLLKLSE